MLFYAMLCRGSLTVHWLGAFVDCESVCFLGLTAWLFGWSTGWLVGGLAA